MALTGRSAARLEAVDLLRGLAILLVLFNHVNMRLLSVHLPYTQGLPPQVVSSLVWNGQRGVQMFFAISGFLITSTAMRRWGPLARINLREFYLLRFARIAPLMFALLAVLTALHLSAVKYFVISSRTGGLGSALVAALTFRINVLEATRGYLPGNWDILWSLSVEEVFYLVFPLLCVLLGRSQLLVTFLCAFVVIGPFARTLLARGNEVWQEYSYLGGMDAIALGCLTALLAPGLNLSRHVLRILNTAGATLLLVTLCFSLTLSRAGLQQYGLDMTLVAVGTCMIAAAAQTNWRSPRVLAPALSLGRYSYEVYLTHMFVVFGLFYFFTRAGGPMYAAPILFLGVIVAAGALGRTVSHFYTEPLNRWIRLPLRENLRGAPPVVTRLEANEATAPGL